MSVECHLLREGKYDVWRYLLFCSEDMFAQDSIDLLTNSGIQFKRHEEEGIDVHDFAELLMTSGIVLTDNVKWLSFHRLVHVFWNRELPRVRVQPCYPIKEIKRQIHGSHMEWNNGKTSSSYVYVFSNYLIEVYLLNRFLYLLNSLNKILKNTDNGKKIWKSRGILSVRKCEKHGPTRSAFFQTIEKILFSLLAQLRKIREN